MLKVLNDVIEVLKYLNNIIVVYLFLFQIKVNLQFYQLPRARQGGDCSFFFEQKL